VLSCDRTHRLPWQVYSCRHSLPDIGRTYLYSNINIPVEVIPSTRLDKLNSLQRGAAAWYRMKTWLAKVGEDKNHISLRYRP
jgi:hypothetical protein